MAKCVSMKLGERLALLGILPETGTFLERQVCRHLQRAFELKREEFEKYKIQDLGGGRIQWSLEADKSIEFDVTDGEIDLIKKTLEKLDKEAKLRDEHVSLYELFVVNSPKAKEKE